MPAFGAYTGGLNVRDRAFADVFGTLAFTAHMLGERRLYAIAAGALPAGLSGIVARRSEPRQSRRLNPAEHDLAIQPVKSAIMAVARP